MSISNKGKKHRPLTEEEKEQRRQAMIGRVITDEWKQKISKANKGKTRGKGKTITIEHKKIISERLSKSVNQYNLDGKLIKKYNSIVEAEKELRIDHRAISRVCLGKRKQTHGYIWEYSEVANNG